LAKAERARGRVIAVDGPAASGKGTLARRLAAHYGLRHLESGALYRAVALGVLESGGQPGRREDALAAARALRPDALEDPALRKEEVAQGASEVAAMPEVRRVLLDYQRRFAAHPGGAVIDGRDIGTVVCPDAEAKLFVTASLETRVGRRLKELQEQGARAIHSRVLREMEARDRRDSGREISPLVQAQDAVQIDTTELDADEVFQAALAIIEEKFSREGACPGA